MSFVAHFQALVSDNFGILTLFQVLIADSFGILALHQVLIAENFGILALFQVLIADSFGILALHQVLIAEKFGILALFPALIADNFGILNTLGNNKHHTGLELMTYRFTSWYSTNCATSPLSSLIRHDTKDIIEETYYKRQEPFFPQLTTKHSDICTTL